MKDVGPMPVDEFWSIVDEIGWGTKTTDSAAVEKWFLRTYPREKAAAFRERMDLFYVDLQEKLAPAIERYFGFWGDSVDDLLHHLIGLGREKYEWAIEHPGEAVKTEAAESFAYCIPHTTPMRDGLDDYGLLDNTLYFAKEAWRSIVEDYSKLAELPDMPQKDIVVVFDALCLLGKGNWQGFLEAGPAVIESTKRIEAAREAIHAKLFGANTVIVHDARTPVPWMARNLLDDVERYLAPIQDKAA